MAGISLSNSIESMYRYVAFDVETTGLSPKNGDRVIEIGAVAIDGRSIVAEFSSLMNAGEKNPMACSAGTRHNQ